MLQMTSSKYYVIIYIEFEIIIFPFYLFLQLDRYRYLSSVKHVDASASDFRLSNHFANANLVFICEVGEYAIIVCECHANKQNRCIRMDIKAPSRKVLSLVETLQH